MAGLALDQAGVRVDPQTKKIVVDQYDASVSMPHIFAIGDVAMVSHLCVYHMCSHGESHLCVYHMCSHGESHCVCTTCVAMERVIVYVPQVYTFGTVICLCVCIDYLHIILCVVCLCSLSSNFVSNVHIWSYCVAVPHPPLSLICRADRS